MRLWRIWSIWFAIASRDVWSPAPLFAAWMTRVFTFWTCVTIWPIVASVVPSHASASPMLLANCVLRFSDARSWSDVPMSTGESEGFVTGIVAYRRSTEAKYPAAIHDFRIAFPVRDRRHTLGERGEHFGRVEKVARLVEARGARFNMTLDHSHVIFKIDNPEQQEV